MIWFQVIGIWHLVMGCIFLYRQEQPAAPLSLLEVITYVAAKLTALVGAAHVKSMD